MKYVDNISELANLLPDYIGFIFYEKSPRFVSDFPQAVVPLPGNIKKTGVFVNQSTDKIEQIVRNYDLQAVQLHGNEIPEDCKILKDKGFEVIKAISIRERADILEAEKYDRFCDYLLFDTKTANYGGSGKKYDWNILSAYQGKTPFFLSGGIGMNDIDRILSFQHPGFYGIDLNSCFEIEPAVKNIDMLQKFLNLIRSKNNTLS